ncbi:unnamed protein product [Chrysoparadoxa australica]
MAGHERPEQRFFATKPFFDQVAEAGFIHALLPTEYGGAGYSNIDLAIAAEELMAVDVSVPSTMLAVGLGLQPLLLHGTHEQKQRFLPDIVADPANRLAALAFSDVGGAANFDCPDPGAGMQTFAHREGDEWVINGKKQYTPTAAGGTARARTCSRWSAGRMKPATGTCRPRNPWPSSWCRATPPASRSSATTTPPATAAWSRRSCISTTCGCRWTTSWASPVTASRSSTRPFPGPPA